MFPKDKVEIFQGDLENREKSKAYLNTSHVRTKQNKVFFFLSFIWARLYSSPYLFLLKEVYSSWLAKQFIEQ